MLLNSETAVKVAHDVIHNSEEFFAKWSLLTAPADDVPEGYVDFEFADGALLRVPCVWQIMMMTEGAEKTSIIFKRDSFTVEWKAGMSSSAVGAVEGLISDGPIKVGALCADSISVIGNWGKIIDAAIKYMTSSVAAIENGAVDKLVVEGAADIVAATFENLTPWDDIPVTADLETPTIENADVGLLTSYRESISPALRMNAFDSKVASAANPRPATDAVYDEYVPLLPFDSNARPINGFKERLAGNPFFPDWFYVWNAACPWRPDTIWVPSREKPSVPSWQDTDGKYWHAATVVSNASGYGAPNMIYPPRCRENGSNIVLAPVIAAADGLVVTVQFLSDRPLPICITDTYTRRDDGTWYWYPGTIRRITGPCVLQYILKRRFTEIDGEITAIEYQFLPLGDSNGGN